MAARRRTRKPGIDAPSGDATPGPDPRAPRPDPVVERLVSQILDPVLIPLGFAPAQVGHDQAIFCRGEIDSTDRGCVDLVLDLDAAPAWHIIEVRYWGLPSDRWRLAFVREGALADQLTDLAGTIPAQLADGSAR